MKVTKIKRFIKSYHKIGIKFQKRFDEKLVIFMENPFHETLRNHPLHGEYAGLRSIDITGDLRAIFQEYPNGTYEFVDFIDIGTHSQLYKN